MRDIEEPTLEQRREAAKELALCARWVTAVNWHNLYNLTESHSGCPLCEPGACAGLPSREILERFDEWLSR